MLDREDAVTEGLAHPRLHAAYCSGQVGRALDPHPVAGRVGADVDDLALGVVAGDLLGGRHEAIQACRARRCDPACAPPGHPRSGGGAQQQGADSAFGGGVGGAGGGWWVGRGVGVVLVSGGGGEGDVGDGEGVGDRLVVEPGGLLGVVAGLAESLAVGEGGGAAVGAGGDVVVVADGGVAVRGAAAAVAQVDEVGEAVAEVAGWWSRWRSAHRCRASRRAVAGWSAGAGRRWWRAGGRGWRGWGRRRGGGRVRRWHRGGSRR